jgi:hypothetical protein
VREGGVRGTPPVGEGVFWRVCIPGWDGGLFGFPVGAWCHDSRFVRVGG